jgi:hypothetical protein
LSDESGVFEAAPDGAFLIVDSPIVGEEIASTGPVIDIELLRVDLPSLERSSFASCMSPRLSPGGKWIVCRTRHADVVRVPIGGGTPEIIVQVGSTEARFAPYALIYPEPVEFPQPDRMTYGVDEQNADEPRVVTVPFVE